MSTWEVGISDDSPGLSTDKLLDQRVQTSLVFIQVSHSLSL